MSFNSVVRDQTGGIVTGWLIRLVIIFGAIGLVVIEATGVFLANGRAHDTATKAAQEAGFKYRDTGSAVQAEDAARAFVDLAGAEFISHEIDQEDRTSSVTLKSTARTIFIHRIGAFKKYVNIEVTETTPLPG